MTDRTKKWKLSFVERVHNSFGERGRPARVDVFAGRASAKIAGESVIEISIHVSDERHVTSFFTPDDGEELIEAIRKAIDMAKAEVIG